MNEKPNTVRRILGSIALIAFAAGFAGAAWAGLDDAAGTHAGLFGAPVLDLRLEADGGVDGFLPGGNLAPGDRVGGTLRLVGDTAAPREVIDLDFDVHLHANADLARQLHLTRLAYGDDDLLSDADGGLNLTREIDANPILGDGDGRLSLWELRAGANDLPAPGRPADGGTAFLVEIELGREIERLQRAPLEVRFVFRLGDALDADLN